MGKWYGTTLHPEVLLNATALTNNYYTLYAYCWHWRDFLDIQTVARLYHEFTITKYLSTSISTIFKYVMSLWGDPL